MIVSVLAELVDAAVKFGAFDVVPPVVPNTTVVETGRLCVNNPVPDQVKPVAFAISRQVTGVVVVLRAMLPEPNIMSLVLLLLDEKSPQVKVKPAPRLNVPLVRVIVELEPIVKLSLSVTV